MRVGIVGLGLIGGTVAKALKPYHKISGFDISTDTIEYAKTNQIIDEAYTNLEYFFKANDVVFLCLYPNDIVNFIFQNKHLIPISSLIIEMSGIKKYLIDKIDDIGTLPFDIVYSHPIAGSEKIGIRYSNANIFKEANYIITPVKSNLSKNIDIAKNLAKEMGFKYISVISKEEHDNIIAYTSQLTHVLSLSLVNAISTNLDTKRFIGDSYRDLTRISIINNTLWPELFIYNKEYLLEKISDFEDSLKEIKDAIATNDWQKLSELMQKSTKIRLDIETGKNNES